jgi:hypothetical protein
VQEEETTRFFLPKSTFSKPASGEKIYAQFFLIILRAEKYQRRWVFAPMEEELGDFCVAVRTGEKKLDFGWESSRRN